jgi:N-acetylglucosamine-6-phosphate deacetylase
MRTALVNARVLAADGLRDGLAVLLQDGRIEAVAPDREIPRDVDRQDLGGNLLLPGFLDLQVNGGGGRLFNDAPTPETAAAIAQVHRRFGVTRLLPTLISDDLDVVREAFAAIQACRDPGVLGIHVEGPFLAEARKGIHDSSKFRALDQQAVRLLSTPHGGKTLVTLAPEAAAPERIAQLVDAGVVVSLGHTNATYAQARAALDAGATGFTHLFNAMSPLASREPGVVGAALEDRASWCGVIVDGLHVHPTTLKLALGCKPTGKLMLVTDAMPGVGLEADGFMLQGRAIRIENNACLGPDGTLAGSNLDMASAVRNAVALLGLDLAEAARMASRYPAEFLGLGDRFGRIAPGYMADLVLVTEEVEVLRTWVAGAPDAEP